MFRSQRDSHRTPAARAALTALVALVLTAGIGTAAASAVADSHRGLPKPIATPHEGKAIEGFAPDQAQFFCRSRVEPGVRAFERRVLAHYRVSTTLGDMRSCAVAGSSEHKDGRAWDWGVDHRIPAQRAAGKSMLRWLFATDAYGNRDAMFRRLGLMYIIWNKQIWGAWSQHWEPYSCSGPTLCHVNHMHFSFGWAGAEKKTSYWAHRVSPVVEPPLPVLRGLHAHRTLHVLARTGEATAHWLVKGGAAYRVTASGVWHHGHGHGAVADAVCTKTRHGWTRSGGGAISIGGDQLHGWGLQWTPAHDNGAGCDTKNHTYRLTVHPLLPSTVELNLADSSRGDDAGGIKVSFTRVG